MRWWFVFLFVLLGCSDPTAPGRPGVALPSVVSLAPAGSLTRAPRFTIELSQPLPVTLTLVTGRATDADVGALARGRPSAALSARIVPHLQWSDGVITYAQPKRLLPAGEASLVVAVDGLGPSAQTFTVVDGPVAKRVDPGGTTGVYCVDGALPELPARVTLAPSGEAAIARRSDVPCFELAAETSAESLPPPDVAGFAIDPSPLAPTSAKDPEPCPDGATSLAPLCARVFDDRLVLVGDVSAPRLVLGTIDERPVVAPLAPGARVPLVGLAGSASIDLLVRDAHHEQRLTGMVSLAKPRRHVVVNEVLSHAPSGASTQRFVELANDGIHAAFLGTLILVDGDVRHPLPSVWLAPGELAVVVPKGFVDGLAGDVIPAGGTQHIEVDALKLTGPIAVLDPDGPISSFPASASTRTISRGRRTTSTPDDAPDAFGWDANGRATPGRPNALE